MATKKTSTSKVKPAATKKTAAKSSSRPARKVTAKTTTASKAKGASKVLAAASRSGDPKTVTAKSPTTVIASADVGWGNALYIRGEGAGLNWDKGILMSNLEAGKWEWSTRGAQSPLMFKFLINDELWSAGDNLRVACGCTSISTPVF